MEILNKNYVKYGLILALLLIPCLAIMELTGSNASFENKSPVFFIYQFIAPFVVWYLGLKAYKKSLKGKMNFKEGVKEGLRMSLVFGIVSPFIFAAYYLFVNPEILEYVKVAYNLPSSSMALVIGVDMLVQFFAAVVFGTIYAAIVSFFLKSKKA